MVTPTDLFNQLRKLDIHAVRDGGSSLEEQAALTLFPLELCSLRQLDSGTAMDRTIETVMMSRRMVFMREGVCLDQFATGNIRMLASDAKRELRNQKGDNVMAKYSVGDHVRWNSEAGRVSGHISKVHEKEFEFKGRTHHATEDEPQYEIESDKTDHVAAHKESALKKLED